MLPESRFIRLLKLSLYFCLILNMIHDCSWFAVLNSPLFVTATCFKTCNMLLVNNVPSPYQYDKSSLFTIFSVLFPVGVSNIFNNREVTRYSRNNRTFLSVSLIIFRIKSLHVYTLIDWFIVLGFKPYRQYSSHWTAANIWLMIGYEILKFPGGPSRAYWILTGFSLTFLNCCYFYHLTVK